MIKVHKCLPGMNKELFYLFFFHLIDPHQACAPFHRKKELCKPNHKNRNFVQIHVGIETWGKIVKHTDTHTCRVLSKGIKG